MTLNVWSTLYHRRTTGTEKGGTWAGNDRHITPVSSGALAVTKTASRTTVIIRDSHDDLVAASRETPKDVRLSPPSQQQQQLNLTGQRFIFDRVSMYGWLPTSRPRRFSALYCFSRRPAGGFDVWFY